MMLLFHHQHHRKTYKNIKRQPKSILPVKFQAFFCNSWCAELSRKAIEKYTMNNFIDTMLPFDKKYICLNSIYTVANTQTLQ